MVDVVDSAGGQVLQLRVDLVMENCRDFFEVFKEVVAREPTSVLLDFTHIRFIDSSGIGILLKCSELSRQHSSALYIFGLNRQLDQVFKLAGLMKVFDLLGEEAVRERYPELGP